MMDTTKQVSVHDARREPTDRYFLFTSATLLALLVIAFSPTFFLKAVFDTDKLPIHLHIHGAVITLWFVWLLSQTSLIALNRTGTHRRFGKIAAIIGFLAFAIYFRRRPEIHKRLMLFASLVIMGPAFARISLWPVFSSIGEIPFVVCGILILMGTLFVHDLIGMRRLHATT